MELTKLGISKIAYLNLYVRPPRTPCIFYLMLFIIIIFFSVPRS